ncbi:MAG: hypothetical protein WC796_02070 [Candidatus Pacearchaeota archaeon]|jgi:hypothetical protein
MGKEIAKNEEKKMREGNISLVLESYNDLFSDFDPRGYSERAISDDFLVECKRAARDKDIGFELRLLVPKTKRDINDESKIKKRLKSHFQKHYFEKKKEVNKIRSGGLILTIFGMILLLVATFIYEQERTLFFSFIIIVIEPAGWFTTWIGLEKLFLDPKEEKLESIFYRKMASVTINFIDY